ncbi:MAG TPA: hypothetical protein DF296_00120 [Candidatus Margulisbacteria bacterium]|nr:MAG: hypothetical protein A2X41_00955 [Candidatus Margulisbacteria bacterium GWE2_39_32]HAR63792.1 hypothetical protein [Candidatus Margulisiibacteriota bacterium]HCT83587.1 hypothetical protein [Candidatus Margulisiibacteriota bacterium]
MDTINNDTLKKALSYHQQGNMGQAELLYTKVLDKDPDNIDALRLLAAIAIAKDRFDNAEELLKKAIALSSSTLMLHYDLGMLYFKQNLVDQAILCYKRALLIDPLDADTKRNYVIALQKTGNLSEALRQLEEILTMTPDSSNTYQDLYPAFLNLGLLFNETLKRSEAIQCYRKAIDINPKGYEAYSNLGLILKDLGQLKESESAFQKALAIKPGHREISLNIGILYKEHGLIEQAIAQFQNILFHNDKDPLAHYHLANILTNLGYHKEASNHYEIALSNDRQDQFINSEYLLSLHYEQSHSPQEIHNKHKEWADSIEKTTPCFSRRQENKSSPRTLRIGYVSANFCNHSVAFFIAPVLINHNKKDFTVICYSDTPTNDAITEILKNNADIWRDTRRLSDLQISDLIINDKIDILIDLGGHTYNNRLQAFARKPAPVQITYLGYPDTTGLTSMNYRITDDIADPSPIADGIHSEKLLRPLKCFLCYMPLETRPTITNNKSTGITFGSFSHLAKINDTVIDAWATILANTPESKLLLKSVNLKQPLAQQRILNRFRHNNISESRLILEDKLPDIYDHLNLYNSIDIALDTFPYNGTTTTCEALWMGVPVITLQGDSHVSRVGSSILSSIGCEELITKSIDKYITKALSLAEDIHIVRNNKVSLQNRMKTSQLTDGPQFTTALETMYQKIWQSYMRNK